MKKNIERLYMVLLMLILNILKEYTNISGLILSILIVFLIYLPSIIETIKKHNKLKDISE